MPKLAHVTPDELAALKERAEDLAADLAAIESRLQRTIIDGAITGPLELSAAFLRLSTTATETALKLMHRPAMDELRAATEAQLRKRQDVQQ